jgi:CheY-like chemotaxis protein
MINKLLLIDDDELTSYLIKKLVKGIGEVEDFQIRDNGIEGLDYLNKLHAKGQSFPELILLDIDMPVMNGYEFAENYENNYWHSHPETRIVMVTSSKRKLDFEKCLSYECVSDCIYKPLTREKMEHLLLGNIYHNQMKQA